MVVKMKFKGAKEIIFSGVILSISFFAAITGTYAWFSATRAVNVAVSNVSCYDPTVKNISYEFYQRNENTLEGELVDSKSTNPFILDEYDSFILSRNEKIDKIIRVTVDHIAPLEKDMNISLKANCGNAEIFDKNSLDKKIVDRKISNIIQFQAFLAYNVNENNEKTQINASINEESADTIFSSSHSYFKSEIYKNEISTFIDISTNANSPTKEASKNIQFCDKSITIPQGTISSVFYVDYTYNPDLIDFYFANSDVDKDVGLITGGNVINFDDDIETISIHFSESSLWKLKTQDLSYF